MMLVGDFEGKISFSSPLMKEKLVISHFIYKKNWLNQN